MPTERSETHPTYLAFVNRNLCLQCEARDARKETNPGGKLGIQYKTDKYLLPVFMP